MVSQIKIIKKQTGYIYINILFNSYIHCEKVKYNNISFYDATCTTYIPTLLPMWQGSYLNYLNYLNLHQDNNKYAEVTKYFKQHVNKLYIYKIWL
jgi:hypothetical protein